MNNATSTWISRSVERLRPAKGNLKDGAGEAPPKDAPERSTHERLAATLRRGSEALSPRALRHLLAQLQDVVAPRV
ncbi:MAG TPA: malonyl-CoA decarboxylase, partial [Alicycliphilus sp.]|nr:malonyl-CoA decarboxylase [Alicycliphilus sp.]